MPTAGQSLPESFYFRLKGLTSRSRTCTIVTVTGYNGAVCGYRSDNDGRTDTVDARRYNDFIRPPLNSVYRRVIGSIATRVIYENSHKRSIPNVFMSLSARGPALESIDLEPEAPDVVIAPVTTAVRSAPIGTGPAWAA
ncbi:hypothetical protein EVAR_32251_1 [Eumeta japonica]|uniref:Uncharacterized protein n=1 Tax=Eumeta variegata TaxID=151549 RepID=A0A4C1WYD1_EUMVA|nr:hypothetical protein EVAR_32251_1 [Eumeta japonica]